jgi:hypothetical protein
MPCAGELVLLEAPVATVVRTQYTGEVCHMCFKDMLAPAPQGPRPYKRYCSRACAQADAYAGLTQALHALVQQLNVEVLPPPMSLHHSVYPAKQLFIEADVHLHVVLAPVHSHWEGLGTPLWGCCDI